MNRTATNVSTHSSTIRSIHSAVAKEDDVAFVECLKNYLDSANAEDLEKGFLHIRRLIKNTEEKKVQRFVSRLRNTVAKIYKKEVDENPFYSSGNYIHISFEDKRLPKYIISAEASALTDLAANKNSTDFHIHKKPTRRLAHHAARFKASINAKGLGEDTSRFQGLSVNEDKNQQTAMFHSSLANIISEDANKPFAEIPVYTATITIEDPNEPTAKLYSFPAMVTVEDESEPAAVTKEATEDPMSQLADLFVTVNQAEVKEKISHKIKELRLCLAMTRNQFADEISVSSTSIYNMETSGDNISKDFSFRLFYYLYQLKKNLQDYRVESIISELEPCLEMYLNDDNGRCTPVH